MIDAFFRTEVLQLSSCKHGMVGKDIERGKSSSSSTLTSALWNMVIDASLFWDISDTIASKLGVFLQRYLIRTGEQYRYDLPIIFPSGSSEAARRPR